MVLGTCDKQYEDSFAYYSGVYTNFRTVPIVRETGGVKDTVDPFHTRESNGSGFTFDRFDAGLLLDAINRAKAL